MIPMSNVRKMADNEPPTSTNKQAIALDELQRPLLHARRPGEDGLIAQEIVAGRPPVPSPYRNVGTAPCSGTSDQIVSRSRGKDGCKDRGDYRLLERTNSSVSTMVAARNGGRRSASRRASRRGRRRQSAARCP